VLALSDLKIQDVLSGYTHSMEISYLLSSLFNFIKICSGIVNCVVDQTFNACKLVCIYSKRDRRMMENNNAVRKAGKSLMVHVPIEVYVRLYLAYR